MLDTRSISQFIHNERDQIRLLIQKGVYSIEFALGHLAGLINLAAAENLTGVMEDIKTDIHHLINDQLFGAIQARNGDSELDGIIHFESPYMKRLRDAWSPDSNKSH